MGIVNSEESRKWLEEADEGPETFEL